MKGEPTLLVATGNPGKLREYQDLLRDAPFRLVSLREFGITDEVDETGDTFAGNAWLKASGYAAMSGMLTLADDSGLEVDALGGDPGVRAPPVTAAMPAAATPTVLRCCCETSKAYPGRGERRGSRCVINVVRPAGETPPPGGRGDRRADTAGVGSWLRSRNGTIRTGRQRRLRLRPGGVSPLLSTHRRPTVAGGEEPHQPPGATPASRALAALSRLPL